MTPLCGWGAGCSNVLPRLGCDTNSSCGDRLSLLAAFLPSFAKGARKMGAPTGSWRQAEVKGSGRGRPLHIRLSAAPRSRKGGETWGTRRKSKAADRSVRPTNAHCTFLSLRLSVNRNEHWGRRRVL